MTPSPSVCWTTKIEKLAKRPSFAKIESTYRQYNFSAEKGSKWLETKRDVSTISGFAVDIGNYAVVVGPYQDWQTKIVRDFFTACKAAARPQNTSSTSKVVKPSNAPKAIKQEELRFRKIDASTPDEGHDLLVGYTHQADNLHTHFHCTYVDTKHNTPWFNDNQSRLLSFSVESQSGEIASAKTAKKKFYYSKNRRKYKWYGGFQLNDDVRRLLASGDAKTLRFRVDREQWEKFSIDDEGRKLLAGKYKLCEGVLAARQKKLEDERKARERAALMDRIKSSLFAFAAIFAVCLIGFFWIRAMVRRKKAATKFMAERQERMRMVGGCERREEAGFA